MQRRRLTITLDSSEYRILERLAKREQRTAEGEASYLLGAYLADAPNHIASTAVRVPDHE